MDQLNLVEPVNKVLEDFLLSQNDIISEDQFYSCFPKKYRDDPEVQKVYRLFARKRRSIQRDIHTKIQEYVDEQKRNPIRRKMVSATSATIDDTLNYLDTKEAELDRKIETNETRLKEIKNEMDRFKSRITSIKHKPSKLPQPKHLESVLELTQDWQ